jgi:flagellar basal-body rod protein FlgB
MVNKLAGFLFNKVGVEDYRKFLDITSLQHKLTAGNVANVTTPGYRSQNIDFQAELKRVRDESGHLKGLRTDINHIPLGQDPEGSPDIHRARVARGDLNSVDIDREVTRLAENELMFTVGAKLLQSKFSTLKKIITSK